MQSMIRLTTGTIDELSDDDLQEAVKLRVGSYAMNDVSALRFADALQRLHDAVLVDLDRANDATPWLAAFSTPKGRYEAHDAMLYRAIYKAGLKAIGAK